MIRTTVPAALLLAVGACGDDPLPDDSAPEPSVLGCDDPRSILDHAGQPSGYVRCADGSIDRSEAKPLAMEWYAARMDGCGYGKPGHEICTQDADCTERPNGKCESFWTGFVDFCDCVYLCAGDEDCEDGQVCISPEASTYDWPVCVAATCSQDADCPSGECGVGSASDACARTAMLACRSENDTCRSDEGCREENHGNFCLPWGEGASFTCANYWVYD